MTDGGTVLQAGAIVFRRRASGVEILLVGPSDGGPGWHLPKGHVEPAEDIASAALREVHEETGVIGGALAVLEPPLRFRSRGEDVKVRYVLVQALAEGPAAEARARGWVPLAAALRELTHEDARGLLGSALPLIEGPAERPDRFDGLLLQEHAHLGDSLLRNEEDGERRATYFLSLVTAVAALLTFTIERGDLAPSVRPPVLVAAIAALALLGVLTFRRIVRRNEQANEYKRLLAAVRARFLHGPGDARRAMLPYDPFAPIPRRSAWRSLKTGGWLGIVAVVEALVAGAFAATILPAADWGQKAFTFWTAAAAAFVALLFAAELSHVRSVRRTPTTAAIPQEDDADRRVAHG